MEGGCAYKAWRIGQVGRTCRCSPIKYSATPTADRNSNSLNSDEELDLRMDHRVKDSKGRRERERKFQTLRDVYVTMYAEISRRLKAVRWGFAGGSYLWHLPRGTIVRLAGICRQSLAVIACPYTFQPFLFLLHLFNFAIFFLFLLFIFPCSVHRLLKGRIWEIWIKRFFPFLFFYDHFNNVK